MDRDRHRREIAEQGYTIIADAIEPALVSRLRDALAELEDRLATRPAANSFEGHHTLRVYNLLAHGEIWQQVPVHPNVLPVVDEVLDPGCLVSSLSSIEIGRAHV